MTPRQYISKLARMRRYLNDQGLSQKNKMSTEQAMKKLITWLEFYPKATDEQVKRFLQNHLGEVMTIMPGESSPTHHSLMKQLNTLLYAQDN